MEPLGATEGLLPATKCSLSSCWPGCGQPYKLFTAVWDRCLQTCGCRGGSERAVPQWPLWPRDDVRSEGGKSWPSRIWSRVRATETSEAGWGWHPGWWWPHITYARGQSWIAPKQTISLLQRNAKEVKSESPNPICAQGPRTQLERELLQLQLRPLLFLHWVESRDGASAGVHGGGRLLPGPGPVAWQDAVQLEAVSQTCDWFKKIAQDLA